MATSNLTLNPYRPTSALGDPFEWIELNPTAEVRAQCVRKDFLFREILLSGYLEARIVWDARGAREFVAVAGKRVVEKFSWLFVPHFDFTISTPQGRVDASIDVRVAWLLVTRGFCLTLNHQVVYQEGSC